jgi:hypothetical protein
MTERLEKLEAKVEEMDELLTHVVEKYGHSLLVLSEEVKRLRKCTDGLLAGIRWHNSV